MEGSMRGGGGGGGMVVLCTVWLLNILAEVTEVLMRVPGCG